MQMEIINYLKNLNKGWKVFLISLSLTFVMATIPHFGVMTPRLVNPLPTKVDKFDSVLPKLEQKSNSYKLIKPTQLVLNAEAASDYDRLNSYLVADFQSGQVFYQKDADNRVPIASLTKVMSAIVALDLSSADSTFQVSDKSSRVEPTRMGVVPGQSWKLDDLLTAALMTSANDAIEVIKEGIDQKYGDGSFVRAMNEKALFLGLENTHFTNPQGFDEGNPYSSASDLAVLTHYALENYPEIKDIVAKDYQFIPQDSFHKQADLYNWNGLLGIYPGVKGVKIGNTDSAGYTTIVLSERDGKSILVVSLGAPGVLERDLWASKLLDIGFVKLGLNSVSVNETQLKEKYSTWKYF